MKTTGKGREMIGGEDEGKREGKGEDRKQKRSNRIRKIGDRKKKKTGGTGKGRKRMTTRKRTPH